MNKIIYIAGYGRSGSTVLDVILGNHPDIVSVGEATYLLDEWHSSDRQCACGQSYRECDLWRGLERVVDTSDSMRNLIRGVEQRKRTMSVLRDHLSSKIKRRYRTFQRQLFSYIGERSGKPIIVDSSKSARDAAMRFYALSEIAGLDVYVVHLVRDGHATMDSYVRKGSNWALEGHRQPPRLPGFRAAVGWTLANAWTIGLAKRYFHPDRYLRVHYEELARQPVQVLQRIGCLVGTEVDNLIERVETDDTFEVGHNVGGNRLRQKDQIRLRAWNKSEVEYNLSWYHRGFFNIVGGGLQHYMSIETG